MSAQGCMGGFTKQIPHFGAHPEKMDSILSGKEQSIFQHKNLTTNMPSFIVLIKNQISRRAGAFNEHAASDRSCR